jgi:uncharacterized protein (TIGR03435 family)
VSLPEHPDLDWLRKQAKRLLKELRETNPAARLADAQFDLARRHGFSSWRALKAHVDALTVDPLVAAALAQADRSEPTVKAAALLHLARVVNALDRAKGEQVLNQGLAPAADLREPERSVIPGEAVSLAAVVSPARGLEVAPLVADADRPGGVMTKALLDMMRHGHETAAVEYVAHAPTESFPFDVAQSMLGHAGDEATRVAIVRRAIAAARAQGDLGGSRSHGRQGFPRLFATTWRLLPPAEAREVLRDLVDGILAAPDGRTRASWNDARFSSSREFRLFEMFAPLRQLLPDLAARLAGEYPQLAAALERYPDGAGSLMIPSLPPAPPPAEPALQSDDAEQPDYMLIGSRLIPMSDAVRSGFNEPFEIALRHYAADSDPRRPNDAPQECWPSAYEFRNILFKAGQHEGKAAVRHLERIPDPNLRLFAQIELAAALVGLPQMGGRTIEPGPAGFRGSMARRAAASVPAMAAPLPFVPPPPALSPDVPPSYEVQIAPARRSREDGPGGGSGPDFWVIEAATLRPVIARLWGVLESRIDVPDQVAGRRYDFTLVMPRAESRETMTRLMREGIEKHFRVTREIRSMEVDVLTAPRGIDARETYADDRSFGGGSFSFVTSSFDGPPAVPEGFILGGIMDLHMVEPEPGSPGGDARAAMNLFLQQSFGANSGAAINSISESLTMEQLCRLLEGGHDRPIVDETGLTAAYDINVHSEALSTREFLAVLCDSLGLSVIPGRRGVEMLVVREK